MKQSYLISIILGFLSFVSITASAVIVDGINYSLDKTAKTAKVIYNSSSYFGAVSIPSTITYSGLTYIVTSIGNEAFAYSRDLSSVTIPNSVTSIGEYAFEGCNNLISITIGNGVTSIGSMAFYGCRNLNTVTINSNTILSKEFSSYSNLKSIFGNQVTKYVLGDDVTRIGNYAFYECSGLTSITIGNGVTSIGDMTFSGCSSLRKVIVNDIAAWCNISFSGTPAANPLYYAYHLYSDENTEITKLTIPNSVTRIKDYAFYNCFGLTSVTIPESVTSIGNSSFRNCI